MVGDMVNLLVTSTMVYHVNMWRSNCDELLGISGADIDLISADNKPTQRIELFSQRPCPGEKCEIGY
jgi:hypothetical protein